MLRELHEDIKLGSRLKRVRLERYQISCIQINTKGSFTPSDYVAVTVTLTGGAFHLDKQIKGAARQRYDVRYVIAWCE